MECHVSDLFNSATRILVFNQQAREHSVDLLQSFHSAYLSRSKLPLSLAVFCSNATSRNEHTQTGDHAPNHYFYAPYLAYMKFTDLKSVKEDTHAVKNLTVQRRLSSTFKRLSPDVPVHVVGSLEDTIALVMRNDRPQVFVTGSLHLVGGMISILDG